MKQRQFEFRTKEAEDSFMEVLSGPKSSERASKAKAAMLAAREAREGKKVYSFVQDMKW